MWYLGCLASIGWLVFLVGWQRRELRGVRRNMARSEESLKRERDLGEHYRRAWQKVSVEMSELQEMFSARMSELTVSRERARRAGKSVERAEQESAYLRRALESARAGRYEES